MEDYTKFRLKPKEELAELISDKDSFFVIACGKCFKEFTAQQEPECSELTQFLTDCGKKVTGSITADFLCSRAAEEKIRSIRLTEQTENILAASCGIGIQSAADLSDIPVFAACDSVSTDGFHSMALTNHLCSACGQCWLNITGGICPVADCSKSLTNGQCGGSENGRCETDKSKNCAWEEIYRRLGSQGRTAEFQNQPVQIRDYSKNSFSFISGYVSEIRAKRSEGFSGGIYPQEFKQPGSSLPLIHFPEPSTAVISLQQHAGAAALPAVSVNDYVKAGQKIGEASAYISSPVHSGISGTVTAVEPRFHPLLKKDVLSVVIKSDGKNVLHESVKPCSDPDSLTPEEIAALIRDKGIVGMGGAGFPSAVKLDSENPPDTILLNGCECEPMLTADHRIMLEYADDVIAGLRLLMKASGAQKGVIAVEDNKADAAGLMRLKVKDLPYIRIAEVRTKYPQGAEKILIKRVLGREVPKGGLPRDVGTAVFNVSTAKAVSDAVLRGIPLTERAVSVTGRRIENPGNFIIKIGTSVKDILNFCGCETGADIQIKMGGPIMGTLLDSADFHILKTSNGIIASDAQPSEPQPCIRCGRCSDVCPADLLPLYFAEYAKQENWHGLSEKNVRDCIECGCCENICASKIPIVSLIRTGKKALTEMN